MSSQEFILIPKEKYVEEQFKSSEILFNPTISEKDKQLTLLGRKKTCCRKRRKLSFIPNGRKVVRYCGEKGVKFIIDVEARTA